MKKIFTSSLLMLFFCFGLLAQEVTDVQTTLITKISADWCPHCGTYGWEFMKQMKTAAAGKDAILWNVHHSGGLETPTTNDLANNFGGFSQPIIYLNTDEDDLNLSSGNITQTVNLALEAVELNSLLGALVAMGGEAKLKGNELSVNAKAKFLTAASNGSYSIGMYIVQKNKVAFQQSLGNNAVHPSVVTNSILPTTFGNTIATAPVDENEEFELSGNLSNLVLHNNKLEDTKVVIVLWNKSGNKYTFVNARELDIVLDNTSGIDEIKNEKLSFVSSSFKSELDIQFNHEVSDNVEFQLYSLTGQMVPIEVQKISSKNYKISTNDISGNHFLAVRENNQLASKQVLIIK